MNPNNIIETLRKRSVKSCFGMASFNDPWLIWKRRIEAILDNGYSASAILGLGDHLSEIFLTTKDSSSALSGRPQSTLSRAGNAWEGLVCWYLNLCLIGSRSVAIRVKSDLPMPLRDAICVSYENSISNTESDLTIVTFPEKDCFIGSIANTIKGDRSNLQKFINQQTENFFHNFEVGIVQCKTNWRDNSQIPMLWNLIYSAKKDFNAGIPVGRNNFSIRHLKKFTYSFCTVPTGGLKDFTPTSMPVKRVKSLSGGNYWGRKTTDGVARSIREIFNTNLSNSFLEVSQRTLINEASRQLADALSYFDIALDDYKS
ncbi:MAG TPA: hypothetical protein VFE50_15740 [Cyclobacteriaceae bacterium]|nr:hypothetical protein [Cyclobacteriaceae bacterium]